MERGRTYLAPLGEVDLFVHELGERRPDEPSLLVVHGGPDWDHTYLLPGLEQVASTRHVVAFDLRGCGRSSKARGEDPYQPERVVDDVAGLIRWLGQEQVDLLGFSTGGQVAQLVVEAHARQVRRLVLASTTAYAEVAAALESAPGLAERRAVRAPWPEWAGFARGQPLDDVQTTAQWAIEGAPASIWDLGRLQDYLALLSRVRFTGEWLPGFRAGQLHPWRPRDPVAVLRSFPGEVLILHGAQDLTFPVDLARRLHHEVPGSHLTVLEDAGHMAQFDRPGPWAAAITAFLGR